MHSIFRGALALAMVAMAAQAGAQITIYQNDGFEGRSFTTRQQVDDLSRMGFNDRASSAVVGSERWEVCEDARFGGRCVVLRAGRYPSLSAMGLNDRVSSVRAASSDARVDGNRYVPAVPALAVPRITFYENENFGGESFTAESQFDDFRRNGFNHRASSVIVVSDRWEVCEDIRFGRCVALRAGSYPSLAAMGLNDNISSVRMVSRNTRTDDGSYVPVAPVAAKITFYENEGFGGRSFTTDNAIDDFKRNGFNDRASSVVVVGDRWEVCEHARFGGRCIVLRGGSYPSLVAMGLNDSISSVRALGPNTHIDAERFAPVPVAAYDYQRRDNERLYEADVTSVRAVMGTPEQRCWIEPGQVAPAQSSANVPAAIFGAVIGGILGHQVGGGRGKDLATVGGAVAGGALGANIGRDSGTQQANAQNVQRCTSTPSQARPDYWDVTYNFRGIEHRVQLASPPGATITVNGQGEPRA